MKTTREAAREEKHRELVKNLQELLEKNYDTEKSYKRAMEGVKAPGLRQFLKKQAVLHNHFATEIHQEIHELNAHPREHSSTLSNFQRMWMDLKSYISKDDDEALLQECLRGERASIKEYEERLKKFRFPPAIESMLKAQLKRMRESLDEVDTLKDLAPE